MFIYVGEEKLVNKAKRVDVAFFAQRALQELSFDTFKCTKSHEIEVPATLTMTLPQDYVNYVKLVKVDSNGIHQVLYPTKYTSDPTAPLQTGAIGNENFIDSEIFEIPIQSKISFKNIDHIKLRDIQEYRKVFSNSSLKKDILYKKHLDKAFYKKVLLPFSILVLVIYFGSLIFTSLRDATLGGRILVAVIGAFIYNLIQDLSIGVFISYGLPVLIGVLIPSIILIAFSIFSYKRI